MTGPERPWDRPAPELEGQARPNAAGMGREALARLLTSLGEKPFRTAQVFEGLYRHRWADWEDFTMLSKALRGKLRAAVDLRWPEIVESASSEDGSTKHAFRMGDGSLVEGVHMPYEDRATLCLSSQVGCAMGCTFCATGRMGILRNLTSAEIAGQVIAMLNHHAHPEGKPVNLVFMGMGEPLHNLAHVMDAFALLHDPGGLAIPPRRVTVSTSGLVAGIQRLATFHPRPRLALSLNATTDERRSRIMPVNRVWNLEALAKTLQAFPLNKGERITLEYVLLKGETDSPEDAKRLAAFAKRFPSKINLIPFNPHEGAGFEPPDEARINELGSYLSGQGLTISVRRSRGQDIAGACGQLARRRREQEAGEED
ncbi:MAG TPA: 23S rRNA (adenine(2503)-C(2))-methyltransferase RlmN [Holophaga sp.]|nr:23S rRNA (adenine(2503)-C(2))-methyltransferase RlmN [Holophaga sp.]